LCSLCLADDPVDAKLLGPRLRDTTGRSE
jgi:hypothetical protein